MLAKILGSQYTRSLVRAIIAIAFGVLASAAARGDQTTQQFLTDLETHWIYFLGAVAAPVVLAAENKLGDSK